MELRFNSICIAIRIPKTTITVFVNISSETISGVRIPQSNIPVIIN